VALDAVTVAVSLVLVALKLLWDGVRGYHSA